MKIENKKDNHIKINNFILRVILVFLCGINFSCSSFKTVEDNKETLYLTKENINLLDGVYLNNAEIKGFTTDCFWGKIYTNKEYESVYELVYEQKKPYFIKLKALNEKQIQITIYVDNKFLKSFVLKGKLKNGYFEQSRRIYIIPMVIFNMYHNSKFRIGKLKNENVITDYNEKSFAHYVFEFKNNSQNLLNIEHIKLKNDTIK
ncbi:hypothetical protein RF683_00850 [Flavobacterium sp. 20NA77.7]|uniref:Lipoprotein n=1 Tax=Flavobacterium nakdongensis TaxID=3073563 RepID=A0ABY9RCJ2_9FLAO|nr:hypothetical protein [Flavobacterium sp. 20NA77.7]WMW78025.1 hypothetical protein RF683_00850 [Flavobacterium sp. 20NA77.7]